MEELEDLGSTGENRLCGRRNPSYGKDAMQDRYVSVNIHTSLSLEMGAKSR